MKLLFLLTFITLCYPSPLYSSPVYSPETASLHLCANCQHETVIYSSEGFIQCHNCLCPNEITTASITPEQKAFFNSTKQTIEITAEEQALAEALHLSFEKDAHPKIKKLLWLRTCLKKGDPTPQRLLFLLVQLELETFRLSDPLSQALNKLYRKQLPPAVKAIPSTYNLYSLYLMYVRTDNTEKAYTVANLILTQEKENIEKSGYSGDMLFDLGSRKLRTDFAKLSPAELIKYIDIDSMVAEIPRIRTPYAGPRFTKQTFLAKEALYQLAEQAINKNEKASLALWKIINKNENVLIHYINSRQANALYSSDPNWAQWDKERKNQKNDPKTTSLEIHFSINDNRVLDLRKTEKLVRKEFSLKNRTTSGEQQLKFLRSYRVTNGITKENNAFHLTLLLSALSKTTLSKDNEYLIQNALSDLANNRHRILPLLTTVYQNKKFSSDYIRDAIGTITGDQDAAERWQNAPPLAHSGKETQWKIYAIMQNPIWKDQAITAIKNNNGPYKEEDSYKQLYLCSLEDPEIHQLISDHYLTKINAKKSEDLLKGLTSFRDYLVRTKINNMPFKVIE